MSAMKACVACTKQIPSVAVVCVFCSGSQPCRDPELAEPEPPAPEVAALPPPETPAESEEGEGADAAESSGTDDESAWPEPSFAGAVPPTVLMRLLMTLCGAVLLALFFCPWHGVSSWRLLSILTGAAFAHQLSYLVGGVVLLFAGSLPLPPFFRAGVGLGWGALPLCLGAGGVSAGGPGILAALAVIGLAAQWLRRREEPSPGALGYVGVTALALLYVLPTPEGLPISLAFSLLFRGSVGLGLFLLAPLALGALSLCEGRRGGLFLSALILAWPSLGVMWRGHSLGDATQIYVGVGLLWASGTAALCLSELVGDWSRTA